ncbi:MAG: cation:proton antiporter [Treponema sp.]|uniref:cation:proton antiporter domain-containing protein n=1 Tax=Treponema sp. TaxID=166 RepID=UPI00298E0A1E|nr:cation:proton antiporter [Treponema sp.]MCQ2601600.1 cation:proton antiporter [Treponema sp.]
MDNPISSLLPEAMHFWHLQGVQLVLLLGIIIFFGALGGWLFKKLRIPQVVGYIVIGIIIGSSGFRILEPGVIAALNPVSTVSLSLIGFLVGGELKLGTVKKYGKQFVSILIFESITPAIIVGGVITLVVWLFTKDIRYAVSLGVILGAICAATAPAATTDVLVEYRTRGPLTTTVYGIVAMDDAVALVLYTVASTIAASLLGDKVDSFGTQLLAIAHDIFGSVFVGLFFGGILRVIMHFLPNDDGRILSFTLGALFLSTGICEALNLDNILSAMSLGFFMVNFSHAKTKSVFNLTSKFTPPVYVLFFVLVGAKLNIWIITPFLGLLAILYVVGRTFGKTIGSMFGAWLTKAPVTVQKYLPFCLLSQAGVAIGLSIAAGNDFPDSIGPQIMLIITATTFIVQLIGPICVKSGVTKAGEVGLNVTVDDIRKNAKVKDVMWGNDYICDYNSPTVVSETDQLETVLDLFSRQHNLNYVVKDDNGKLIGVIVLEHLKEVMQIGEFAFSMLAVDVMDRPVITCKPDDLLPNVYSLFDDYDVEAIPIVDEDGKAMGILEHQTADHYLHARVLELNRKLESLDA